MATKNGTTDRAVEIHFPPQEIDPKEIAREAAAIALQCRAALASLERTIA